MKKVNLKETVLILEDKIKSEEEKTEALNNHIKMLNSEIEEVNANYFIEKDEIIKNCNDKKSFLRNYLLLFGIVLTSFMIGYIIGNMN
jgi:hypothetical protein